MHGSSCISYLGHRLVVCNSVIWNLVLQLAIDYFFNNKFLVDWTSHLITDDLTYPYSILSNRMQDSTFVDASYKIAVGYDGTKVFTCITATGSCAFECYASASVIWVRRLRRLQRRDVTRLGDSLATARLQSSFHPEAVTLPISSSDTCIFITVISYKSSIRWYTEFLFAGNVNGAPFCCTKPRHSTSLER